ncbi:hypothetical protein FT643_11915 [Ketobacter sp. MCCC 1A13808]|uniref:hypothetical protein n=1 Tax=Ketobacter sp. MCCC 1A13808 TaxID=2602738 RepID=UPI0012EB10CE|nr:hypothetical protein [Ketobacter sp. MCCC 1A13808]MVF12847.1 hypothetical protein [Ketobacter sp. MCCC 1A13808]
MKLKLNALLVLSGLASIAVLILLRINNVPLYLSALVLASYFLWILTCGLRSVEVVPFDPNVNPGQESFLSVDRPELDYFERLTTSLLHNWSLFKADYAYCEATIKSGSKTVEQAMDMATNTGLLAINSMFEAAKTGDIGKGFVTVSQDLVAISKRSAQDIEKLKNIVSRLGNKLDSCHLAVAQPIEDYRLDPDCFPLASMEDLLLDIRIGQKDLTDLAERHRRNPKLDVRWLQLGDAVRRLLNELTNALYQLEVRLEDVLTDMRLVRLSGTLDSEQVSEINGRVEGKRAMVDHSEKIM